MNALKRAFSGWGLYKLSYGFFVFIIFCLVALIFVDIVPQSFSTGQFWNGIIACSSLFCFCVAALILSLARMSRSRVWLHQIPRDYTISRRDTPGRMIDVIESCGQDCREKFEDQILSLQVDHPGLRNPSKGEMPLEAPYISIVEVLPHFVEESMVSFYSRFVRKRGVTLRQYLYDAIEYSILPRDSTPNVEAFLRKYEKIRFGRDAATEQEFYNLFAACLTITRSVIIPHTSERPIGAISIHSDADSDKGSVIIHEKQPGSFLQTISRQPSFSTAVRNNSSDVSLPEMVQRYVSPPWSTRSRRNSERTSFSTQRSVFFSHSIPIPSITVTRYPTHDSQGSSASYDTFVHHQV